MLLRPDLQSGAIVPSATHPKTSMKLVGATGFEPVNNRLMRPGLYRLAIHPSVTNLERKPGFEPSPSAWRAESYPSRFPAIISKFHFVSTHGALLSQVLVRCTNAALLQGNTSTFQPGSRILATAYIANTDEMELLAALHRSQHPSRTTRVRSTPMSASEWSPRCLHDIKLLMN